MKKGGRAPQVDAGQFKLGMRNLAGAVTIVTTAHAGRRFGMTATAVCSVCAEPPTLLVCIHRAAATHAAIAKSGIFCVNVLRAGDAALAGAFSGAQSGEGRFDARAWSHLATGCPVLLDSLVALDCRVTRRVAYGSHKVFFGRVERVLFGKKGRPLLYADGRYARLAPLAGGRRARVEYQVG